MAPSIDSRSRSAWPLWRAYSSIMWHKIQRRLEMVTALYDRVRAALTSGHFPLVYGADCAVLLAAVPALADAADPARAGTQAAEQVASQAPGWWLHTDLDVLAGNEFSACGAAADPAMPGGLSWAELATVVSSASSTRSTRAARRAFSVTGPMAVKMACRDNSKTFSLPRMSCK